MFQINKYPHNQRPWNKGRLMGQKMPLTRQEIWSIRAHLQSKGQIRESALFNLALDSKLRACDLLKIRVSDISSGDEVNSRAIIRQKKTSRPVQFEITARTRKSISDWIDQARLKVTSYLFPSQIHASAHLSTRQYSRIVESWVLGIGLDASSYGTHSLRRTKATLLYRRTKNLRAVQLLLGHAKLDSTVRYLGIDIDDALELSEQIDVWLRTAAVLWRSLSGRFTVRYIIQTMPTVSLDELQGAVDWVSSNTLDNKAYVCRQTGKIYWVSGDSGVLDEEDEIPNDVDDVGRYAMVPDKHDLDLGNRLVFRFTARFLAEHFDEVRNAFRHKGAYGRFREILYRQNSVEEWYAYSEEQTIKAHTQVLIYRTE